MLRDRQHAGRLLAEELAGRDASGDDATVYGIPRGGVIVAAEIARRLDLPLDVLIASKVGAPGNPEYAIGAVDQDGIVTPNERAGYTPDEVERLAGPVHDKISRRIALYRRGRPQQDLSARVAIIVDDGIATGLTAVSAVEYAHRHGAARIVLAVPVIAPDAAKALGVMVDELVALEVPDAFRAVGEFYRHFDQTSDDEVLAALSETA